MRKQISVDEAKSSPLYHGTSEKNAYQILKSDMLKANISNETETMGVSFTRNKDEWYDHIVFVIDQEKLSSNYRIVPVYRDGVAGRDLAEERVERDIKNLKRYIIRVDIRDYAAQKRIYRKRILDMQPEDFSDNLKAWKDKSYKTSDLSYLYQVIQLCHKQNIPIGPNLKEIEKYLEMKKNGETDQEIVNHINKKRGKSRMDARKQISTMEEKFDSTNDAVAHINIIRQVLGKVIFELQERAENHDNSKLEEPEKSENDYYIPLLKQTPYASPEYIALNKERMEGKGLKHHFQVNRHHPEHFENGVRDMTLVDIVEMFCDWYAASKRSDTDFLKGLEYNQKRHGMSDELIGIFRNTFEEYFK